MERPVHVFSFGDKIEMAEVESSLVLALMAVENLHGESSMCLDARHTFDSASRQCVIDTGSDVGRDLAKLFVGFLNREFDPDAFKVERVGRVPETAQT